MSDAARKFIERNRLKSTVTVLGTLETQNRYLHEILDAFASEQTAALRQELDEWRVGAHADETGHLHRCAKINGAWSCAAGCAKAETAALRALVGRLKDALGAEHGELCSGYGTACDVCALLADAGQAGQR